MKKETHIYGIRAILEALQAGQEIDKIYLQKGLQGKLSQVLETLARKDGIRISYVPEQRLDRFRDRNHQGAVATISPVEFLEYQQLIDKTLAEKQAPLFLLLDGVSDVRNLGAIIRTAACTGVDGIILPASGSAPVTADTIKTSAGAVFKLPMAKAPHIKDAVFYLQACGIQVVAATEKARDSVFDTDLCKGTAIIMGSEGKGVSPAVLKAADTTARLPMAGSIASLNVSVACGVFLYEVVRQRTSQ
ncbi:MAG: 23S rRNA (guanosine(2251)-2'-O)-methyltransferase RlmB [Flavobacteriaceae bacterium]|nr:MAG: 23S rRNA (guanosine(2251)-2'-O)-methyltransferase RlmB [Flavobacteriaceae bacterium]